MNIITVKRDELVDVQCFGIHLRQVYMHVRFYRQAERGKSKKRARGHPARRTSQNSSSVKISIRRHVRKTFIVTLHEMDLKREIKHGVRLVQQ